MESPLPAPARALPLVLLIGAGGVGAPAALALARSGRCRLRLVDDDRVELTNLHRQILFGDSDLGRPKLEAMGEALRKVAPDVEIEAVHGRFLPETASALLAGVSAIVDGCDNFATRFLAADAARLAGLPIAHGASIRWQATCLASAAGGRPCYRCLFEDVPVGPAPDCATAGVLGPVCGVAGGLAADAALRLLAGDAGIAGTVASFDGRTGAFRRIALRPRPGCPLCGERPSIHGLDRARYVAPACEA
ncbi:MAG: HesA/MoeB/ThiF family protein [Myxococcales bacterium]|nr:MAG: HesA/MoeB/ThiF family protein [Myxococcales bacterium]